MNTSFKLVAVLGLFVAGQALAASAMTYTLELGGDNYAEVGLCEVDGITPCTTNADCSSGDCLSYENGFWPAYKDTTELNGGDAMIVNQGEDVDWAVVVDIAGNHSDTGEPWDGLPASGAANLVFDLELQGPDSTSPASIGHATLDVAGEPTNAGWYSTINDGEDDFPHPNLGEKNAAFCSSFDQGTNGSNGGRVIDPWASGGPNMDFNTYPSAQGLPTAATAGPGELVGMGAGYEEFKYVGATADDSAGVAISSNSGACIALGIEPLFEGQISTVGLDAGTYTLVLTATEDGNNVLPGDFFGFMVCSAGFPSGRFALKVNNVDVATYGTKTFTVVAPAVPPAVDTAMSYKDHGGTEYGINVLDRTDDADVECRWSGPSAPEMAGVTKLVVVFDMDIQRLNGDVTDVEISSGGPNPDTVTLSASNELTIEMSGTTNGVPLTVDFPGIAKASDAGLVCTDSVCIRQLVGDARASGNINAGDRIDVRNQGGLAVTASNFRCDVRADGTFNVGDRIDVRNAGGTGFVGSCP